MNKTDPYVDDTVEEVLADAEAMREALEDATTAAAAMIKTEGKIPRIDLDPDAAREQFARYLKAFGPQKLGQELYANLQEMNLISDGRSARRLADGITVILQDGTFRLGEQEPTQDPHVLFLEILQKAGPGGISKTDAKEQMHDLWPQIRTEAASLVRTHARVTGENRDRWVLKELYVAPEPGQPEPVVEESSEEPDGPVLNAEETVRAKEEDFTVPFEDPDLERESAEEELSNEDLLLKKLQKLELLLRFQSKVEELERRMDFVGGQVEEILFSGDPDLYWIAQLLAEHGDRIGSFSFSRGSTGVTVSVVFKG